MKTIVLDSYGIKIELEDTGGGIISSDLKEVCPYCNDPNCDFDCPDALERASDRDFEEQIDKNQELQDSKTYNHMMDAIESMILAHAVAGVDVTTPAYLEGIETAVQGCANNI